MNTTLHASALRRTLSATAAAGGTTALMLVGLAAASAHVEATPDNTAANSYALLTFAIPHGCNTSGTTKMTITLPAELNDAQPTVNPNWTARKVTEHLPAPQKLANGTSITKRTSQIIYTAKAPLDPELRDTLVLSVKLPDTAGKTLYFPTLQTCQQGQTDWSQIPKEGQDEESLKSPAPSVTVTEAEAGGDGHTAHAAGTESSATESSAAESSAAGPSAAGAQAAGSSAAGAQAASGDDGGAQARSWGALAAGLGGLALGGAAFVRGRAKNGNAAPRE